MLLVSSYNLQQILSNEPTCSKYWDNDDACSSGAETISIRALSVGSLFECEESRSGYVDIDRVKPGEQVSHVPSTYVAHGSGKKGFPPPKDKVGQTNYQIFEAKGKFGTIDTRIDLKSQISLGLRCPV